MEMKKILVCLFAALFSAAAWAQDPEPGTAEWSLARRGRGGPLGGDLRSRSNARLAHIRPGTLSAADGDAVRFRPVERSGACRRAIRDRGGPSLFRRCVRLRAGILRRDGAFRAEGTRGRRCDARRRGAVSDMQGRVRLHRGVVGVQRGCRRGGRRGSLVGRKGCDDLFGGRRFSHKQPFAVGCFGVSRRC